MQQWHATVPLGSSKIALGVEDTNDVCVVVDHGTDRFVEVDGSTELVVEILVHELMVVDDPDEDLTMTLGSLTSVTAST